MTLDDVARKEKPDLRLVREEPSWQDLFKMDHDELKRLAARHQQILVSGTIDDQTQIAPFHARELLLETMGNEADWIQVLNYIDFMLDTGQLGRLTADEIHETNGEAPSFSRLKTDKNTAKSYNKEGLLIESARFYPGGTVVRTFHSVFSHPDFKEFADEACERATKGQEFYYSLIGFIEEKLDSKNQPTEDEQLLAAKLEKAAPIRPLNSENRVLDNVFVNGCDVQEYLERKDSSVDERVAMLSELTDIDLITSFYSRQFRKTRKGKSLYTKGRIRKRPVFRPNDYRREVFEKILLKADKEFFAELVANGVISTAGVVHDEKAFRVFYDSDKPQADVLRLIGIDDDNIKSQQYFTPFDLNLGNVMVSGTAGNRHYTMIDFERSQEDSLESLLFSRWVDAGIYDHTGGSQRLENGNSAEQQLLDDAYDTIRVLHRIAGEEEPDKAGFDRQFSMQKKKHLLRLARRYKSFEKNDKGNAERLRATKRFFYTLFTYELAKEGSVAGSDDKRLDYLNSLFEAPLLKDEMQDISERFDPGFRSSEELSPIDVKDVESKNQELLKRYAEEKRSQAMKRWALRIGIPAAAVALLVGAIYTSSEFMGVKAKMHEMERQQKMDEWMPILHSQFNSATEGTRHLKMVIFSAYNDIFKDKKTAAAACLDLGAVVDAARQAGLKIDLSAIESGEYARYESHLKVPYEKIKPKLWDINRKVWGAVAELDAYTDRFMIQGSYGIAKKILRREAQKKKARDTCEGAWKEYDRRCTSRRYSNDESSKCWVWQCYEKGTDNEIDCEVVDEFRKCRQKYERDQDCDVKIDSGMGGCIRLKRLKDYNLSAMKSK